MMNWFQNKLARIRMRAEKLYFHAKLEFYWALYGRRYRTRSRGKSEGLVVSLTSYPPRFGTLHMTLRSLLSQSFAADRVVLWIANDDMKMLPESVTRLVPFGLEIRACNDLKSYKKLIPLLEEDRTVAIVTADDDIYYWPSWLEELAKLRDPERREVICHRMHRIRLNSAGIPLPYSEWDFESENTESSILNFPTGIGGILYPPGVFSPEILDEKSFMEYCPRGDDIWFWWMARTNGATFKRASSSNELHCWEGTQEVALWKNNLVGKFNDDQIAAMIAAYGFFEEKVAT